MTEPRVSQAVAIAVASTDPPPIRNSQLAAITVQFNLPPPVRASSLVAIAVSATNTGYLLLKDPIPLNCWQPCTSYGTTANVVILGG